MELVLYNQIMLSPQAHLVKLLLKHNRTDENFDLQHIKKYRRDFERNMRILFPTLSGKHIKKVSIGGVDMEWITPLSDAECTIVYVHGGSFALGSARAYRQHLVRLARMSNARIISIDYKLAPEHPFPHAMNQALEVWGHLCEQKGFNPSKTVLMGDSAGANIALAAALKLRDTAQPLPACIVLLSTGLDATFTGESYEQNAEKDVILSPQAIDFYMQSYVQGHKKEDPLISPVFADLHGLPPLLIHIASTDLMLSSSLKLYENAKRDGIDAQLLIGKGMWHNWHLFAGFVPEARRAMQDVASYVTTQTGGVSCAGSA